jgi:hypothetical protein
VRIDHGNGRGVRRAHHSWTTWAGIRFHLTVRVLLPRRESSEEGKNSGQSRGRYFTTSKRRKIFASIKVTASEFPNLLHSPTAKRLRRRAECLIEVTRQKHGPQLLTLSVGDCVAPKPPWNSRARSLEPRRHHANVRPADHHQEARQKHKICYDRSENHNISIQGIGACRVF